MTQNSNGMASAPSRLSLAAMIIGILALPAGLMPLIGIAIAMVALLVAIVALVRANRQGTARNYPTVGLVLAILAMALALITTKSAFDFPDECQGLQGEQLTTCIKEHTE